MENTNIYITLKEAENLIFKRFLTLPVSRLKITKAQKLYSINIRANNLGIIQSGKENFIILFSAVNSFEIPEVEKSLFLNNYFIPGGMIIESTRKFKDEVAGIFNEDETVKTNEYYTSLRNGYIGVFKECLASKEDNSIEEKANAFYKQFENLSLFKRSIIKEFIEINDFPQQKFDLNTLRPDKSYRIAWLLKKANELLVNYNNADTARTEDQIATTKEWFKNVLNNDESSGLKQFITEVPNELKEDKAFIFGYFVLANHYEQILENPKSLKNIREILTPDIAEEAYLWAYFFNSMLNKDIFRLFFLNYMQENLINIEKLALQIAFNFENDLAASSFSVLKQVNTSFEKQIEALWELKYGVTNATPAIIDSSKIGEIFNTTLAPTNLSSIGIVATNNEDYLDLFNNSAYFDQNTFVLQLTNPEVVFYGDSTAKNSAFLKKCNIKPKPFEKLIDSKKKVLVVFIAKNNPMLNFYASCLGTIIRSQFEKIVCIWLVNESFDEILSTKFSLEKDKVKASIEKAFNNKIAVELIVKNTNNTNDTEIKRNCYNALKEYKTKEIELIHDNFDNTKAEWLLQGNTEFYIQDRPKKLDTYYNNI